MRHIFYTSFIVIFFGLISCSNNSGTNPNTNNGVKNICPMQPGDWWIYDNYTVDSTLIPNTKPYTDSTYAGDTTLKLGKFALPMISVVADSSTTNYFYSDSNTVYAFSDFVNPSYGGISSQNSNLPIFMSPQWAKIIDRNANTWNIFDSTYTNSSFQFSVYQGNIVSGNYMVSATKQASELIQVGTSTYNTLVFKLSYTFTGKVHINGQADTSSLNITFAKDFYFADEVGLVRVIQEPQIINLAGLTIPVPGSYRQLIRFYVK